MNFLRLFLDRIVFKFRGQILSFSELPRFGFLEGGLAQWRMLSHVGMRMKDVLRVREIAPENSGLNSLLCHSLPNGLSSPMEIQIAALSWCIGKHLPESLR